MLNAPPDITLMATCGTVSVSKGSTETGSTGKVTFEVIPESAEQLVPMLNKESFELAFAQDGLGDGYSVGGLRFRPDADGSARAFVTFVAPESSLPALALLIAHARIGTKGKLVLTRNQTTISDQLSTRAEDPACPFPGCTKAADHSGPHSDNLID
jgi:hypothetical protein